MLVIALILIIFIFRKNNSFTSVNEASLIPETKHIAVLPFKSIGSGNDSQTLAEGLSEIITSKLSQLEQYKDKLWIVPVSEMQKSQGSECGGCIKIFRN